MAASGTGEDGATSPRVPGRADADPDADADAGAGAGAIAGISGAFAAPPGVATAGGPSSRWKGDRRQPFDTANTPAQTTTTPVRRVQRSCDIGRPLDSRPNRRPRLKERPESRRKT